MSSSSAPSDIEIARHARMRPMQEIADALLIPSDDIIPYGRHKAKVSLDFVDRTERQELSEDVDANRKRTTSNAHVASEALFESDILLHLSTLNVKHELVLAA